jgi:hypothetical protein
LRKGNVMTSKAKTEDKAAAGAPENKPAEAPENKGGEGEAEKTAADTEKPADADAQGGDDDDQDQTRTITEMISNASDEDLQRMVNEGGSALALAHAEMDKRGLTPDGPNERGLTAADIAATDHSDAIEMEFLKEGNYDLVGGARIVGRKGDRCALRPDDAKAAVKSGLMAIVEAVAE